MDEIDRMQLKQIYRRQRPVYGALGKIAVELKQRLHHQLDVLDLPTETVDSIDSFCITVFSKMRVILFLHYILLFQKISNIAIRGCGIQRRGGRLS